MQYALYSRVAGTVTCDDHSYDARVLDMETWFWATARHCYFSKWQLSTKTETNKMHGLVDYTASWPALCTYRTLVLRT